MPHEVELKLTLPDEADSRLLRAPLLRGARPRRVRLDATYFDTPDRLLQRHGMALRLRRAGRHWVQTLKATLSARGGLSTRPEWEYPARLLRGEPRLDLALLADTPLPGLLARHRPRRKLRPAFRVRVMRTVWDVEYRHSRIEVALDRGRIEGGRNGQRVAVPVAELELELKDGRPEDLIAAALQLAGRGKGALALVPMLRGKAERGYRLVSGTPAPPTKASATGFTAALRPDTSSPAALRAIVAHGLDVLLANTEALRDVHAPEYVHQARVALRRMRSAVRLLDRMHEDFPATLATELRWAARLLGAARDADVLALRTLPRLVASVPPALRRDAKQLLDRAGAQGAAARERVLAALATARFARLALRLQAWTMSSPPKGRTLQQLAPRLLTKARRRLFDTAGHFATLSPEERHRVRILAKRLRYALDVLSMALPREAVKSYIEALAELQDVMGELNDGAAATLALSRLAVPGALPTVICEQLAGQADEFAGIAGAKLLALSESLPPWD